MRYLKLGVHLDLNNKLPFLIKETSQSIYSLELHKKIEI